MTLIVSELSKSFEDKKAVNNVSFELSQGEIVALLGPSGCGKSTLLNMIAGLEKADAGIIKWHGNDLADIEVHKRNFGLMFQDFALFPHKNVFHNVAFGLKMQDKNEIEIKTRVREVINLVGLSDFETRDVNSLSGGEQQRVALARALAPKPELLMLDEPLGSLDRALRQRLLEELKSILRETQQTTLYVTHDQEEAFALADKIIIMDRGNIIQIGSPNQIYRQPASVFVANFIGLSNILDGKIKGSEVETLLGTFPIQNRSPGDVKVLLRPDRVVIGESLPFKLSGQVIDKSFRGENTRIRIESQGLMLDFSSFEDLPNVGEQIQISLDPFEAFQIMRKD
ncbi:MAG: ABC transporter ATP-binding protein [Chloroflexi bacterium]|nr:ABC transporter ATP-binding protein [Chloroflexota bacterium]MBT3670148.1 ABC transporter ATP-binding protein [Chloroflexota bacterium]MBT4004017.1 ABC transporter ATP-binding protein [Chloroflexota bacterium]MBT4306178.1 ABC transporter ATP-binding protein [Chloroflexota bacterium]MBT4534558.1 ABC transporter ATP-binding protein [Chloroflexota bacterium]